MHKLISLVTRAFIAGGVAACGAVTVTHGFETVKIRYCLELEEAMGGSLRSIAYGKLPGYNYKESCNPNRKLAGCTEASYTVLASFTRMKACAVCFEA